MKRFSTVALGLMFLLSLSGYGAGTTVADGAGRRDPASFRQDMRERLNVVERQIGQLKDEAEDAPQAKRDMVGRQVSLLRRELKSIRGALDGMKSADPQQMKRISESVDRLQQQVRRLRSDAQRSMPSGQREAAGSGTADEECRYDDRGEFKAAMNSRLEGFRKSLDRIRADVESSREGDLRRTYLQQADRIGRRLDDIEADLRDLDRTGPAQWPAAASRIRGRMEKAGQSLADMEEQTQVGSSR